MSVQESFWPYPTVGKIAVFSDGSRCAIWPYEDNSADTFSGQLLLPERTAAQIAVHDVSGRWLRAAIVRIEEPTAGDRALSIYEL